jgi:DNA-directed RNA polymerase subunit RPC12/RpoP
MSEKRKSLLYWILKEKIKNEKGEIVEFDNHCFLLDIYTDQNKEIVIKKGSQVGVSLWAILKSIHDAKYWGINQIHTLPTVQDVQKFVPSKVNLIIKNNPCIFRDVKGEVDAVTQKQIGNAFIFYRGTWMEREAIMLTSDRNIYDELDKSNAEVIRDYSSRLSASKLAEKIYISTPTIPNFGIDKLWEGSDQKHWRFNCPNCSFRQYLEWEKNVDFDKEIYICQKCHRQLKPEVIKSGEWEAKYPGREISGYWIPQMIATWRTAKDLIKELEDAEDEEYFYNYILGVAYLNPEAKIPASLILKNLTNEKNDGRNCAIGVDVGKKELHAILGNEKGIFGITKIEDQPGKTKWQRLGELLEVYEARFCVIDGEWNTNEAYEFARKYPDKVYLNWYKAKPEQPEIVRFADEGKFTAKSKVWEEEIKVLTHRNRIMDALIDDLRKGKYKFNFKTGDERITELVEHLQTMYSRIVTNQIGQEKREWVSSTGKDHYWHSLIYFKIALDKKLRYESK